MNLWNRRNLFRMLLTVPLAAAPLLLFSAMPSRADFRVCNATQNLVGVSIGYRAKSGWITEGWWIVDGSTWAGKGGWA